MLISLPIQIYSLILMLVLGSEIKEHSFKFQIGTQELGNLIYIE